MSGLIIEHLTKSFDGQMVLKDLNIEVDSGSLLVVLGPSGCGKSTLLRLISGLEKADRGRIILDGRDITGLEPQKRKTAMVFQNYALYPHMTVFENMAFPLRVARKRKNQIKSIVHKAATLLELDQLLDRRPSQLSGGQRQRVALGRGLVRQPSIFLLDEPLSNLDAALRLKMRQEIVVLQKRLGITMVYVTHDQTEALTMSDRMVVMNEGEIRQYGTPKEIYDNPRDKFVASFIGTPPINLFDDNIIDGVGRVLPIRYGADIDDGKYTVGVRPEHIKIEKDSPISGEIISLEYIGAVSYLKVKVKDIIFTVAVDSNTEEYSTGQTIGMGFNPGRLFLFDSKQ